MKKSLFAVAAATAFAGAAQAQSSVTVYGILDVGYIGSSSNNVIAQGSKNTTNQFGQSAETTSRLGFRGTEDLGGGDRAFFTAEFQLYPQSSTLSGDNLASENTKPGLQNRQTFVGLARKGVGQFALGMQYTPIHTAVGATDPGQQNNVVGSVIYPVKLNGADLTTAAYTIRAGNSLTAQTENLAGFVLKGMYVQNAQDNSANGNITATTSAGGNLNTTGWALGVDYTWNKLLITANYQALSQKTSAFGSATTTIAQNNTDTQQYYGLTYDFGIVKAYAGYISRKLQSANNTNNYTMRTAQQIGVRGNITKTVEAWANVGNGRYTAAASSVTGNAGQTAEFNAWQLGSNYWLSKRTNLYAIYGMYNQSNAPSVYNENASQYAVGVRHTF